MLCWKPTLSLWFSILHVDLGIKRVVKLKSKQAFYNSNANHTLLLLMKLSLILLSTYCMCCYLLFLVSCCSNTLFPWNSMNIKFHLIVCLFITWYLRSEKNLFFMWSYNIKISEVFPHQVPKTVLKIVAYNVCIYMTYTYINNLQSKIFHKEARFSIALHVGYRLIAFSTKWMFVKQPKRNGKFLTSQQSKQKQKSLVCIYMFLI